MTSFGSESSPGPSPASATVAPGDEKTPAGGPTWRASAGNFLRRPSSYVTLLIVLGFLAILFTGTSFSLFLWSTVIVYAMAAIGQDWLIGKAGQISIGGAAFMGIGAFGTAISAGSPLHYFPIPMILSMVVGAGVGLAVGLPALRLTGIYLVLTTLALQEVFQFWAQDYQGQNLSGLKAPPIAIGSWSLGTPKALFVLCAVLLVLAIVVLRNIYRYAPGNMWSAIREDPLASEVIGIPVSRWRLWAFVGSSALTALGGSLFAYLVGVVSYSSFSLTLGLSLVVMVFLGGTGSPLGVLIGAAAVTLLPQGIQDLSNEIPNTTSFGTWLAANEGSLENMIYGLALIAILLFEPSGLAGIGRKVSRAVARRWHRYQARAVVAPAPPLVAGDVAAQAPAPAAVPAAGVAVSDTAESAAYAARESLLVIENLTVTYRNGAQGVADLSLAVPRDSIVAVVGRNGAGKTTTLRAIAGFIGSEHVRLKGSVHFDGADITGMSPRQSGRRGAVLVPERSKVFTSLTVAEHFKADGIRGSRQDEMLDKFPGLRTFLHRKAGHLSGGERQLLAIALAVARRPQLLLVDELSLGLSPIATKSILRELARIRAEEHLSILLVDQAASAIASVVDYYYLIEGGTIVGRGLAAEISEEQVRAAMIGA
jgi:branched-chain amino acid transport system permease protein